MPKSPPDVAKGYPKPTSGAKILSAWSNFKYRIKYFIHDKEQDQQNWLVSDPFVLLFDSLDTYRIFLYLCLYTGSPLSLKNTSSRKC